jgi:hypothetical protein
MSTEETVDELVDKAIDEVLDKQDADNEEIKKRRPKPFRYITDKEEIQAELSTEEPNSISIMKDPTATEIVNDEDEILGLGDIEAIENAIRKFEASRKIIEK